MNKNQYWAIKKTHTRMAYNDSDEYSVVDGVGKVIISLANGVPETLIRIVNAHNECFLADTEADR